MRARTLCHLSSHMTVTVSFGWIAPSAAFLLIQNSSKIGRLQKPSKIIKVRLQSAKVSIVQRFLMPFGLHFSSNFAIRRALLNRNKHRARAPFYPIWAFHFCVKLPSKFHVFPRTPSGPAKFNDLSCLRQQSRSGPGEDGVLALQVLRSGVRAVICGCFANLGAPTSAERPQARAPAQSSRACPCSGRGAVPHLEAWSPIEGPAPIPGGPAESKFRSPTAALESPFVPKTRPQEPCTVTVPIR